MTWCICEEGGIFISVYIQLFCKGLRCLSENISEQTAVSESTETSNCWMNYKHLLPSDSHPFTVLRMNHFGD